MDISELIGSDGKLNISMFNYEANYFFSQVRALDPSLYDENYWNYTKNIVQAEFTVRIEYGFLTAEDVSNAAKPT